MEIATGMTKYIKFKDFLPAHHFILHDNIRKKELLPKKTAIITPTKKLQYIKNVLENYSRQIYPDKELIIVLNNNQLDIKEWLRRSKDLPAVQIFQLDESVTLGECLNFAIDQADAHYIARFDDDDYYGPYYLIDQIGCLMATNNVIAGKSCQFVYFNTLQKLIICNPNKCYKFVKKDVGGGSLVLEKDIFTQIKFRKQDTAEDYHFIKDCLRNGYRIYSTDPFNYLIIRYQNLDYHTWKVNDSEYITWGSLLPKVKDPRTFVMI